jgi:cell division protein FtsB
VKQPSPSRQPAAGKFLRIRPPANRFAKRSLAAAAGVLVLLLLLSPLLGENGLPVYLRLFGEREGLRDEVTELRQRVMDLDEQIDRVKHDPATLERIARERFNMRLRGEEIYEIVTE